MQNLVWDVTAVKAVFWSVLVLLFLFLAGALLLLTYGPRMSLLFRFHSQPHASRLPLRLAFYSSGLALLIAIVLEITSAESAAMRIAVLAIVLAVSALGFVLFKRRLADSIRRRTTQQVYWQTRASEIEGAVRTLGARHEIRHYVLANLIAELELLDCALFELDGGAFRCTMNLPGGHPLDDWPAAGQLPAALASAGAARVLTVADPVSGLPLHWSDAGEFETQPELDRLRERDTRIAAGFRRASGFAGFLLLSSRAGNLKVSASQLHFIEKVAEVLGQALDEAERLEQRVDLAGSAERERQRIRDVSAARAFLAPPERPEIPGLEYAWDHTHTPPAGDTLLDILSLPNRSLGLLLAEADGSPLEAAIRLVQLQALLRSRFWAYGDDLNELLESAERALLASPGAPIPVRLFCARYKPPARTLHFVNAGFYPPMLLRVLDSGAEIVRLSGRSGPLCAADRPPLAEEELQLRPGDLIAAATPGLAATRSPLEENWGDSRLADSLLRWDGQPVPDAVRLTLRTAEEFSGGNPHRPAGALVLLRVRHPAP